jgi:hypothetical protein
LVNDDGVNGLVSFNSHTAMDGYMVDTIQTSTTWTNATAYVYGVINNIMSFFHWDRSVRVGLRAHLYGSRSLRCGKPRAS